MKGLSIIVILSSCFLQLFTLPSSSVPSKKALLIGIGDYKNLPYFSKAQRKMITDLKGPRNDVRIMREALLSYGFRSEDIKVLMDSEATRDNIIRNFEDWLINGTKERDLAFYYHTGHGTHVKDQNADEDDGEDEALCPYDVVLEGAGNAINAKLIIDDELGAMLRRLRGRDVVVAIDACYSGTVTRNIGDVAVSYLEQTPAYQVKSIPVKIQEPQVSGRAFSIDTLRQRDIPESQIFISSAKEDQKSLEIALPDGFYGVFTHSLVEGMKTRKDITYRELYQYVRSAIKDKQKQGVILDQEPQIEPSEGELLTRVVFRVRPEVQGQKPPAPPKPPVKPQPTPQAKPENQRPQRQKPPARLKPPVKPQPQVVKPQKPPQAPQLASEVKGEKVLLRIEPFDGVSPGIMKALRDKLQVLSYVELVEGDFFDRLVRGEVKGGKYIARILNRIGDVVSIPPTENVDELATAITPHLEYAHMVKQLAHVTHPNPPFKVRVWVTDEERQDFKIGEKVVFNFYSERDCYLLMLNLDSMGNVYVLLPNQFYHDNRITGGETRRIPDERMGKEFEFEFGEPVGEEVVKVIATLEPLKLEDIGLKEFERLFDPAGRISVPEKTRAILVKKVGDSLSSGKFVWSEDTVVIRSHK